MVLFLSLFWSFELRSAERSGSPWLTGESLRRQLSSPLSVNLNKNEFRSLVIQVTRDRGIACVLDRRLNPSAENEFKASGASYLIVLENLAAIANGELSLPGNLVYIGPQPAARHLRTLIELRKLDLPKSVSDGRRSEFFRRRTVEWNHLESPQEILEKISNQFHLKIANMKVVPHDLWAASTLPDITLIEALSVTLIQFDLTFRWADTGSEIELIPVPQVVKMERKYRAKQKVIDAMSLIRSQLPEIEMKIIQSEIVVHATVEDHEMVASLLQGKNRPQKVDPLVLKSVRERKFTLPTNAPFSITSLIRTLEESGIHFEFDANEFKAQGIDLDQTIQIEAKDAGADDFFKSIFGPMGIEYQIDHLTVKLMLPKSKKNVLRAP